jgi:L-fuculose-phosphate aldolase
MTATRTELPDLSPSQELAVLARSLFMHGYDDHNLGHISYRYADDTLIVTPFEIGWDEVRASDMVHLDLGGNVLDGCRSVTPAISLHLALHRARPDINVGIHNHSRWGTVWAAIGRVPPAYDQMSSAIRENHIGFFDEYVGAVNDMASAEMNVEALADNDMTFLGNHGVFVVGRSIQLAHHRAISLEHRCRLAWQVQVAGGGRPMPERFARDLAELNEVRGTGIPHMYTYMVRKVLRLDPLVLE